MVVRSFSKTNRPLTVIADRAIYQQHHWPSLVVPMEIFRGVPYPASSLLCGDDDNAFAAAARLPVHRRRRRPLLPLAEAKAVAEQLHCFISATAAAASAAAAATGIGILIFFFFLPPPSTALRGSGRG